MRNFWQVVPVSAMTRLPRRSSTELMPASFWTTMPCCTALLSMAMKVTPLNLLASTSAGMSP